MESFGIFLELSFLDLFANVDQSNVNKPEVVKVKKTTPLILPTLDEELSPLASEPIHMHISG